MLYRDSGFMIELGLDSIPKASTSYPVDLLTADLSNTELDPVLDLALSITFG